MCVCVPAVGVCVLAHVLCTVYLGGQGLNSILGIIIIIVYTVQLL